MKRAKVSELKAHLSGFLAAVRQGESVIVTDRRTPIAVLVPYDAGSDALAIEEPTASTASLKRVRGVRLRKRVDVVRLLRESRDQR
jgi:prevent-host-death family protein